jgi:O-antigen/teichoic acid export membrane protein
VTNATQSGRGVRVAALIVSAAVAGNQAASYLLNVAAARLLAPAAFGELGSLLAVLVVGAVPAMGLQTVAALRVARIRERGPLSARDNGQLLMLGLATSATITVVVIAASPVLMLLLHLDSVWPILLVAVSLSSITLVGLSYGTLQGGRRFTVMAGLLVFEAVGRIGGTAVGLVVFRDSTGALAGTAVGALLVAFAGWVVCGRARPVRHERGHVGEVVHAVQAMLALVLLVNLDLVLARHNLPAEEAGEYAVGAIVAKIAYWFPQAVAILALPRLASAGQRRRVLPVALGICAALDALVVVGASVFGPTVVSLVGGADYAADPIPVWPFAVVGSLLSLVQLLLFSRIASADRRSTVLIWLAVLVEIALVTFWLNDGLMAVVTAAMIATGLLVCSGAVIELRTRAVEPVDARGHDGGDGDQ